MVSACRLAEEGRFGGPGFESLGDRDNNGKVDLCEGVIPAVRVWGLMISALLSTDRSAVQGPPGLRQANNTFTVFFIFFFLLSKMEGSTIESAKDLAPWQWGRCPNRKPVLHGLF